MRYYRPHIDDHHAAGDAIVAHYDNRIALSTEEIAACVEVRRSYQLERDVPQDTINRCHDAVVKLRAAGS